MNNAINWFEIPVADLDRAQAFYETVLARKLRRENLGGSVLAVFPYDEPATGGCLQAGANVSAPGGSGIRVYLDCTPGIDAVLARIKAAGGHVVAPKSELPAGMGFIAYVRDTEGNEVGLHALA
jgi:uncharacterized protein